MVLRKVLGCLSIAGSIMMICSIPAAGGEINDKGSQIIPVIMPETQLNTSGMGDTSCIGGNVPPAGQAVPDAAGAGDASSTVKEKNTAD